MPLLDLHSKTPSFMDTPYQPRSLLPYVPSHVLSLMCTQTVVLYSIYAAGRDDKLFQDPLKFSPERWERDDEKHAFLIQPFGFGPRMCYGNLIVIYSHWLYIFDILGRRFAELEMKLLLVQVS